MAIFNKVDYIDIEPAPVWSVSLMKESLTAVKCFKTVMCKVRQYLYTVRHYPPTFLFLLVDGKWTHWTEYGACSAPCGKGTKTRTRYCTNPAPLYGGSDCYGDDTQDMDCYGDSQYCPGMLRFWSLWFRASNFLTLLWTHHSKYGFRMKTKTK